MSQHPLLQMSLEQQNASLGTLISHLLPAEISTIQSLLTEPLGTADCINKQQRPCSRCTYMASLITKACNNHFSCGRIRDTEYQIYPKYPDIQAWPIRHSGSVVKRPLCDREVAGSIPGRVIPKHFKTGTSCSVV